VTFFDDKIKTIRENLEVANKNQPSSIKTQNCDTNLIKMTCFQPLSEEEARKIIMKAATKSCALDPIPTWLLKDSLDVLLPIITSIVNKSILSGVVPQNMKTAIVIPLLKKIILDCEIFKNYRPVSNLSFLSKVTEKAVSNQTSQHTAANKLEAKYQSAYKSHHSTETALIRVQNDILMAADDQKVGLLILLDLSAAFDTIDHDIMLSNLHDIYGIEGAALDWYRSYLSERYQTVVINGAKSQPMKITCGVPQGSILGPEMYTKYTKPITEIIEKHGLQYHIYADDTQLYIFFELDGTDEAVKQMEACIKEIREWLQQHMLKLNDEKTEVMFMGLKSMLSELPDTTIHIGNESIKASPSARNIGVIFDRYVTMKEHVIATCKSASFHLYNIKRIRKYLTKDACEKLIHAFVSSKLDYGNALLYGIPNYLLKKMQRIQNTAARIVCDLPKFCHITPVLKELHWLPVQQRIIFKILLLTYKALNGCAPDYICDLINPICTQQNTSIQWTIAVGSA
jgi:hypothetical protein